MVSLSPCVILGYALTCVVGRRDCRSGFRFVGGSCCLPGSLHKETEHSGKAELYMCKGTFFYCPFPSTFCGHLLNVRMCVWQNGEHSLSDCLHLWVVCSCIIYFLQTCACKKKKSLIVQMSIIVEQCKIVLGWGREDWFILSYMLRTKPLWFINKDSCVTVVVYDFCCRMSVAQSAIDSSRLMLHDCTNIRQDVLELVVLPLIASPYMVL